MNLMGVVGEYFPLILLALTISSGLVMLMDQLCFKKNRELAVRAEIKNLETLPKKERLEKLKAPLVIDYCRHLFPVFLLVLVVRSFIGEFYQIPSGSMLPDYLIGDYLYVNKFAYGVHIPVWNTTLFKIGEPKRGDVIIFTYPVDTQVDLIKRVVGVPGDHISYIDKKLTVNGVPVPTVFLSNQIIDGYSQTQAVQVYQETMNDKTHLMMNSPWRPALEFKNLIVPKGEYFVMGDNRDDSEDSRYWGFVDEKYLVGKPEVVVLSIGDHGVRWDRIGHWLS